jgi:hypothetical protein
MDAKKQVRITFAEGFKIGVAVAVGGMMALLGIVLCLLLFTWPLGLALLLAAGKLIQKTFDKVFKRIDRDMEHLNNDQLLRATIVTEEGDDLPWLI